MEMETNINSYKLDQEDKEYIFSTSIVGNKLRMTCQNSSMGNNKKYTRDFSIEQLHKIDKIFSFLQSPFEASDYIDKALNNQKVGVSEENGIIKITFYITTKGITNQIEIPLSESNGSQLLQSGKEEQNFGISNYMGNEVIDQNNIDNLLNSAYSQNNQMIGADQNYFSQIGNYNANSNIFENNSSTNSFDINQFIQSGNNNIDSINQYFQYNEQGSSLIGNNAQYNYDSNQFLQSFQNNGSINNNQYGFESKPYITKVENEENNANFEEQIKQFLQEGNGNTGTEQIDNDDSLKALSGTKVLPIQTTARVLPPIGPFTSLEGLDLHKLANINAQNNSNILFQPIGNSEGISSYQNIHSENTYKETKSQPILQAINVNINETKESNVNKDINIETKNLETKKQLSENESEEIKYLKNQLAELEPLRKKVAEMEVLRGQLTELNTLRAEVAKFNAFKDELKEVNSQLEQLSLENEKLKLRVEELEDIKVKYEEEIKMLKENERIYSMKSRISNNSNNNNSNTEEKDVIYEENSQEMTVKGDIIHDPSELELLTKKINKLNQKLTLNLLYKATADSDKAAAFHAKCDDANSSIVLVETDKGKRFGGYTTCSWRGDCIDKRDEDAFVFSFDKMMTYDNIPGEDAIGCYPKFGPIFLGCQIRIYDNAFTKGGTTFERGLNFDTEEDYELTGGDRSFNVKEIEVYEVIKE